MSRESKLGTEGGEIANFSKPIFKRNIQVNGNIQFMPCFVIHLSGVHRLYAVTFSLHSNEQDLTSFFL